MKRNKNWEIAMRLLLTLMFVLGVCTSSFAGPFGTTMGDTPDKYKNLELRKTDDKVSTYRTGQAPQPYENFERYVLNFWDNKLCAASGGTAFVTHEKALELLEVIKADFTKKYGAPTKVDTEKNFVAWFSTKSKRINLPDDIMFIYIRLIKKDDQYRTIAEFVYQNAGDFLKYRKEAKQKNDKAGKE